MKSIRKVKKIRWMSIKPMIEKIKSYGHKFSYRYGGGYFIFSFKPNEYNLHLTFNNLPDIKFGIWKTTQYGDKKMYFFAEHICWIDKFKPSAVNLIWDSLDEMMIFVNNCIQSKDYYYKQMLEYYSGYDSINEFDKDVQEMKYLDSHYRLNQEEYHKSINTFNNIINNLDIEKYDIIWRPSDGFHTIYDIFLYPDISLTDDEINDFEEKLESCYCYSFGVRKLPLGYWKNPKKYWIKCHPDNMKIYTSKIKHNRCFKNL